VFGSCSLLKPSLLEPKLKLSLRLVQVKVLLLNHLPQMVYSWTEMGRGGYKRGVADKQMEPAKDASGDDTRSEYSYSYI
jgi:hypothetical protein